MHKALDILLFGFALVPFVAARSCSAQSGYTIHGADLGGPQFAPSADLCCSLCASAVTCHAAIYVPSNQSCQRKTSAAHQVVSAGSTVLVPGATTLPPNYPPLQPSWTTSVTLQQTTGAMMRGNRIVAAVTQGEYNGALITIDGAYGNIIHSNALGGEFIDSIVSSSFDSFLRVTSGDQFFLVDGATLKQVFMMQLSPASFTPVYDHVAHVVATYDASAPESGIVAYNASNITQVVWRRSEPPLEGLFALGGTRQFIAMDMSNNVHILDALYGTLVSSFSVMNPPELFPYAYYSFLAAFPDYTFTTSGGNLTKYRNIDGSVAGTYAPPPGSEYIGIQTAMWPDALGFYATIVDTTDPTYPTATAAVSWSGDLLWISKYSCPTCNVATVDAHGQFVYTAISSDNGSMTTLTALNRRTGKVLAQLNGPFMAWTGNIAAFDHGVAVWNYTNPESIMGFVVPGPY